jgi:hypothetical protein
MLEQIHALDFLVTLYQYVPPLYANYIMGITSAAGIVTISKVPGLSFARYAKYGLLLLLAYTLGYILVIGLAQIM